MTLTLFKLVSSRSKPLSGTKALFSRWFREVFGGREKCHQPTVFFLIRIDYIKSSVVVKEELVELYAQQSTWPNGSQYWQVQTAPPLFLHACLFGLNLKILPICRKKSGYTSDMNVKLFLEWDSTGECKFIESSKIPVFIQSSVMF